MGEGGLCLTEDTRSKAVAVWGCLIINTVWVISYFKRVKLLFMFPLNKQVTETR